MFHRLKYLVSITFQDLGYPDSRPGARLCIPSNWWTSFLHRVHSTMALLQPVICANASHERCYMVLQLLQLHKRFVFSNYSLNSHLATNSIATPINSFDSLRMTHTWAHLRAKLLSYKYAERPGGVEWGSVSASCVKPSKEGLKRQQKTQTTLSPVEAPPVLHHAQAAALRLIGTACHLGRHEIA